MAMTMLFCDILKGISSASGSKTSQSLYFKISLIEHFFILSDRSIFETVSLETLRADSKKQ